MQSATTASSKQELDRLRQELLRRILQNEQARKTRLEVGGK
jgi:hypothetical protein